MENFVVTNQTRIDELKCDLIELEHIPSGAKVIHIANEDPENLFCLSFQTLPTSSNGVAHILEHTVLCGSKKFPVKDPFFAMSRRSLNTFLNALTGSDFTCYPAATQVEKDFYNLLDVYIDAVFHPELKKMSFLQEGHRLEFSEEGNPQSPLLFKGIVFNEMKGTLAGAESRLWHAMMKELCVGLPYEFNSGGEPKEIPDLTYEELKRFHQVHYQPSRCLFFFYGNLPLKKHLEFIEEKILNEAIKLPSLPLIPKQKRNRAPVLKEIRFPVTETEELSDRTMVAFGWLTTSLTDQEAVLALSILDSVLMDTDASLLKLPMLESELCIHADAYMDLEMSEIPYVIVCKGCDKKNAEKLEKTLRDTLKEVIQKGIPHHLIESALHQLELSRTEIAGDHAPFGLTLFMKAALAKQHGCKPEDALKIHSLFENINKKIKDPAYLAGFIEKFFLNNSHFVRLIITPDPKLAAEEKKEEEDHLEKIKASLSEKEISEIFKQTKELENYQKETENQDIDCLPKVDLTDVPVLVRTFPLKQKDFVFHHECFTNHVLYADLIFDMPELSKEELAYLQLFNMLVVEVGCGKRKYAENLEYIHAYTGGIGVASSLHVQADDPAIMKPCVSIRGKALYRNAEKLFSLLKETATSCRLDEKKRIQELISQLNNALQTRLTKNALRYAIQLSLSGFGAASYINNLWHGIEFFHFIEDLSKDLSKKMPDILSKLVAIKEKVFCLKNPHLVLCGDKDIYHELQSKNFYDILELPNKDFLPWKSDLSLLQVTKQSKVIASPVAYNCEAFKAPSFIHPYSPALSVATHILENKLLHRVIREQGGAYGAGANYNMTIGAFYLHSYRDPHITRTLNTFHEALELIAKGKFTEKDLEESKLEVIQQLDQPVSPGARAITAYAQWREGKTKEIRQNYRDRLLAVSMKDVASILEKELLPKIKNGIIVTFAGKALLDKENITW